MFLELSDCSEERPHFKNTPLLTTLQNLSEEGTFFTFILFVQQILPLLYGYQKTNILLSSSIVYQLNVDCKYGKIRLDTGE